MFANLIKLKALLQTYTVLDLSETPSSEVDLLLNEIDEIIYLLTWDLEENKAANPDITYIQNLQAQLTYLADGITLFDRNRSGIASVNEFYKAVLTRIYNFLNHIRNYHPESFDFDAQLPIHYYDCINAQEETVLKDFQNMLARTKVDEDLADLLGQFFSAGVYGSRFRINTWRQLQHRQRLFDCVVLLLEQFTEGNATLELLKLIMSFEINSIQIYAFYIKYIEKITLGDLPLPEQQQELLYLLKLFRQVRTEVPAGFEADSPALKNAILESLEAELAYIDQKDKVITQTFKNSDSDWAARFYFKVAVTLGELMFFFRVALETGMMSTKFKSHLYEFIYNHIQTDRAEHISKKSMRNHFNANPFPDKVVMVIRTWLEKMIKHIDLHYRV